MRQTITLLAALLIVPSIALIGFADARHTAQAPTALVLDAQQASSADLYYDLDELALGESFAVAYQTEADVLRLRTDRTDEGYALSFVPGTLRPTAVTVRYLYDGEDVAEPVTLPSDASVFAGVSDEGPDSWHYQCDPDGCQILKDYKKEIGIADGATGFTTAAGERVTVTDVAFELHGLALDAPETIQFETSADVTLLGQAFGPTRR